jgi:hypothetical protein
MRGKLCKISAYLNKEELEKFRHMVKVRDLTESMLIREMLGFDIRPRGAPKGPRQKKQTEKSVSTKAGRSSKLKKANKSQQGKSQLTFLE